MKFTHTVKHWTLQGFELKLLKAINCESKREAEKVLSGYADYENLKGNINRWAGQDSFSALNKNHVAVSVYKIEAL